MGNILILLSQRIVDAMPDMQSTRLQIEENVGEDIHIHYRNMRLEFSINEFIVFADAVTEALTRLRGQGGHNARC